MPKENFGPDYAEKPSREKLDASSQVESRGALDFQDEAVGLRCIYPSGCIQNHSECKKHYQPFNNPDRSICHWPIKATMK